MISIILAVGLTAAPTVEDQRTELTGRIEQLRIVRTRRELGISLMVGSLAPLIAVLVGEELYGAGVGASYFADRSRGGSWQYAPLGAALGLVVTPRLFGQAPYSTAFEISVVAASAFLVSGLIVFLTTLFTEPHPLERIVEAQAKLRTLREAP